MMACKGRVPDSQFDIEAEGSCNETRVRKRSGNPHSCSHMSGPIGRSAYHPPQRPLLDTEVVQSSFISLA